MATTSDNHASHLTPVRRLLRLLGAERRDITYLYVYAALAGVINLSLPLGVQSVIGFVTSGALSTSLIVLIGFIVVGTLLVGGLQIMQLYLVEFIQQRLFARVSLELALRLPRVRTEAMDGTYLPEQVNRMLDLPTLQKGLVILLVDFSAAGLQILLGLILLSFYHPIFIAFGLVLIFILVILLRVTGPNGLDTSLTESKYKYKVVAWLEDVARSQGTFRLAPRRGLVHNRTDDLVTGYLTARKAHFQVLLTQYFGFVAFKVLVTASLLIVGAVLLINKQINIGQFVAAEIVIILVLNAVEKLLVKLDVVYDALTSVDKIGHLLDLPLNPESEVQDRVDTSASNEPKKAASVELRQLNYHYPNGGRAAVQGLNLRLEPGQHLGLAGPDGSGKTSLLRLLAAQLDGYTGVIAYNGTALRDIAPERLARLIADTLPGQELFSGSVLENLTLGQDYLHVEEVAPALAMVNLRDELYALPQGLATEVGPASPLPDSTRQKLVLARALLYKPQLLLLDGLLPAVSPAERYQILDRILDPVHNWTVIVATGDEAVLKRLPHTLRLESGRVISNSV
ncbi:peptidase domain-containing ABC transporter [Hymenobacter arizonensis]|uniref:ABC-type bacteriocin/lantibiotic exporter, contains an N-terminal double-glycine peptidase domain n=1 Tax=Hymenobacter arizonensis TaxID=1227077 RepID=A0A1I5T0A4_HYMAR|nr:ABC transporter ATP-binding protein [Hymenobacter arizonensis]SFP76301.1 ABC-type bacteriocin/lantibiotic exporter, contains an N-terminal double-glycine peptidase domain [Hymenobacter arizonensis]